MDYRIARPLSDEQHHIVCPLIVVPHLVAKLSDSARESVICRNSADFNNTWAYNVSWL